MGWHRVERGLGGVSEWLVLDCECCPSSRFEEHACVSSLSYLKTDIIRLYTNCHECYISEHGMTSVCCLGYYELAHTRYLLQGI